VNRKAITDYKVKSTKLKSKTNLHKIKRDKGNDEKQRIMKSHGTKYKTEASETEIKYKAETEVKSAKTETDVKNTKTEINCRYTFLYF